MVEQVSAGDGPEPDDSQAESVMVNRAHLWGFAAPDPCEPEHSPARLRSVTTSRRTRGRALRTGGRRWLPGATVGATRANDLEAGRTSPDSRSDVRRACERVRTFS